MSDVRVVPRIHFLWTLLIKNQLSFFIELLQWKALYKYTLLIVYKKISMVVIKFAACKLCYYHGKRDFVKRRIYDTKNCFQTIYFLACYVYMKLEYET